MFFVFAVAVSAQEIGTKPTKPFTISIGAMAGLPVGDYATGVQSSDVFKMAYGFDLQAEFPVAPSLGLTLSAGYVDWVWKSGIKEGVEAIMGQSVSFSMIPVFGGAKYYFTDKFYGSAQLGVTFFTMKDAGNAFIFAPGLGIKVTDNFDLLLKYQTASKEGSHFSFLGLRAGVSF